MKHLLIFLLSLGLVVASCSGGDDPITPDNPSSGSGSGSGSSSGDSGSGSSSSSSGDGHETAKEAVKNMGVGWNLGNTLESNCSDSLNQYVAWNNPITTANFETLWGQPVATKALITMFKEAGFNAIRVPVTWYPHMGITYEQTKDKDGNTIFYWSPSKWTSTTVDAEWMKRVHEVVDYVIDNGMYCILNVHHDTGAASSSWIVASQDVYNKQKSRYEALWTQIATEFKDYDEHLLFEGYNEMLDPYWSWNYASSCTASYYDATVASSAYSAVNSFAQSFVNTVRATGGNNTYRNLIVNTYCASNGSGTWNSHLSDPVKSLTKPTDTVTDHIAFQVHFYPCVKDLSSAKSSVDAMISSVANNFINKGTPVIIGEWGPDEGSEYDNYRSNMLAFAKYMIKQCKSCNIATFYWMGLSDGTDRSTPKWTQSDLKDAILSAYK